MSSSSPLLLGLSSLALGLIFLPLSTYILISAIVLQTLGHNNTIRRRRRKNPGFKQKTVLVTGVTSAGGLALARAFYTAGHVVIGADYHGGSWFIYPGARLSKSLRRFYRLPNPCDEGVTHLYVETLLHVVARERVNLWAHGGDCAPVDRLAKEVLERKASCTCVFLDAGSRAKFDTKQNFLEHVRRLGLQVPETHALTKRSEMHKVLGNASASKKSYIVKTDDNKTNNNATRPTDINLLPKRTVSQTYHSVSRITMSPDRPVVLQQYIRGDTIYAQILVIHGEVVACAASIVDEQHSTVEGFPADSAISQSVLRYTRDLFFRDGEDASACMQLTFVGEEQATEKGFEKSFYPLDCSLSLHAAALPLVSDWRVAELYFKAHSSPQTNGSYVGSLDVLVPRERQRFHLASRDLVDHVVLPTLSMVVLRTSPVEVLKRYWSFAERLLFWKDTTFEIWDPLPWWWNNHVHGPLVVVADTISRLRGTSSSSNPYGSS